MDYDKFREGRDPLKIAEQVEGRLHDWVEDNLPALCPRCGELHRDLEDHIECSERFIEEAQSLMHRAVASKTDSGMRCILESMSKLLEPPTIYINGHAVPTPCRTDPEQMATYYTVCPTLSNYCSKSRWTGDEVEYALLKRGLIHLDQESAEKHGRALVSLTKGVRKP